MDLDGIDVLIKGRVSSIQTCNVWRLDVHMYQPHHHHNVSTFPRNRTSQLVSTTEDLRVEHLIRTWTTSAWCWDQRPSSPASILPSRRRNLAASGRSSCHTAPCCTPRGIRRTTLWAPKANNVRQDAGPEFCAGESPRQ